MNSSNNNLEEEKTRGFFLSQIVIFFALLLVVGLSFSIFYRNSKAAEIKDGKTTIATVSDNLENYILQKRSVVSSAADSISYMQKKHATESEILDYLHYISRNSRFGIYGCFDGKYLNGTDNKPPLEYDPKDRVWYTGAINANGRITLSSPYFDIILNRYVVSFSKMLDDGKSVVAVDIMLDDIQNFAVNLVRNKKDVIFVLDHQGYVVAHQDEKEHGKNYTHLDEDSIESRLIKRIFFNPDKEMFLESEYNNKPILLFSREILKEWYIIVLSDKTALVFRTLKSLSLIILGFLLIVVYMILLCTLNFKSRIKVIKYAAMLNKYKTDLEHQVVDQWNQLDKKTHDLVQMQETVIEGMATVIEYRDVNTGMHVQNTKHYVLMIAKYLLEHDLHNDEVNQKYISMIGNAAAMHDIGKVAISDRILNKPGKLDEEEFEIMKSHTIIGAGLVRQVFGDSIPEDMLRMCVDVVQYHHEKWNGKGYPIGLEGEDIPLSARIMAIADVFDAIVSKRVYKDAVPVDEVFEIIQKDAGVHFDPELAAIFLGMKDEIKKYLSSKIQAQPPVPLS